MHRLKRIFIETGAENYPMTRRLLERLPGRPVEIIPHREVLRPPAPDPARWLAQAKETLLLAVQRGPFWRPCPGTRDYICCGYQVLQTVLNCPLDCTYCILQGYVNIPAVTVFVNLDDLLAELADRWAATPGRTWRLGTGEFSDSLALDDPMGLHEVLLPFFARQPDVFLEVKSKWPQIQHLLPLGPNPQIIFAWSINPPALVKGEEHGAASLAARLQAARAAAEAGFRLALHFDPLIFLPGWQRAYQKTVEILEQSLPGRAVGWISMGGLRFLPPLRDLIRRRFPASRVPAAEMVRAPDGKLRYYKSLRLEMYGHLREWLTQAFPDVFIYLCMESPRLWQEVFGFAPTSEELGHLLDRRAQGKD